MQNEADWQEAIEDFCHLAARHPLKGGTFAELRAHLTPHIDSLLKQVTMCCGAGDYPGAWAAFKEAQRHTSNAPALSQLEVLLLLSEGREDEAKARADFWIARLQRDARYEHSELIDTLRNLAVGWAGKLPSMHSARGPLAALADALAHWPAPACAYRLVGGCELEAKAELARLEALWMNLREDGNLEALIRFAGDFPLAGQSFMILCDLSEFVPLLNGGLPGSSKALAREILKRGEALRQTVLGALKAQKKELRWGGLNNRPMLPLLAYYTGAFAETEREACLDLLHITVGGGDEAWVYRTAHLDRWRSTGAMKWSTGFFARTGQGAGKEAG